MKHSISTALPTAIIPNGLYNFLRRERKWQEVPAIMAINPTPCCRAMRGLLGKPGADPYNPQRTKTAKAQAARLTGMARFPEEAPRRFARRSAA
jgi:hypothetical protein